MSELDDVVSVTITANSAAPSREGFGTPLIAGYHAIVGPRVRTYKRPSEMISDGFTTLSPHYKAAVNLCSQVNKPKEFKVGRCLGAPAQTFTIKLTSSPTGEAHSVDVKIPSGTTTTISVTGTGVVNTDASSLATAIDALAEISATANTDTVTVTTTAAGEITQIDNWTSKMQIKDTTPDPGTGIATDLANIAAEDNSFYGLLLTNESEAIVNAAASWANSNKKLFVYASSDTLCTDAGTTTDVASDIKASSFDHVAGIYNGKRMPSYAGAAWMGNRFPYVPGRSTWRYKTLVGVPVDTLTTAQKNALRGKNMDFYVTTSGINCTMGDAQVGSGEYIDVIHFLDWLVAEIQFRVFSIFVNSDKIPFTDSGIDAAVAAITGALQAGVSSGGLSPNPAPVVTAPKASEVSAADKASRQLTGVTFTATLAGAIHTVTVEGTVSV